MKISICLLVFIFTVVHLHAQENNSRGVTLSNASKDSGNLKGTAYAVIVGISDYKYIKPLSFADQDALLFREFLESKAGGSAKPDNILLILNEEANASTQPRIRHWLSALKIPQKGDRVYFYFAGHGDAINQDEYFFLLRDCDPAGDKNNYTGGMASVVQMYNIKSYIKNYLTDKGIDVVFIWDACRTDELPGGKDGLKIVQQSISEKSNGELIMLSASAGEVAIENNAYAHGHGLFTYYLIDGLSGAADNPDAGGNNDGKVDISELDTWVKVQVRRDAQTKFHLNQNPKFIYNNTSEILSTPDSSFKNEWAMQKQQGDDDLALNHATRRNMQASDSEVTELYNRFMFAVKKDSLDSGENSAEALYGQLVRKFPGNALTDEAGFNLAMEYINLAQDKINFYLSGKDESLILSQSLDSNQTHTNILRIKATVGRNFSTNGKYLQRAIALLKNYSETDSSYLKQLQSKMDFLLSRGYYNNEGIITDFTTAMHLAKTALQLRPEAAYNYHLLGLLYGYNKNYDSALLYEKEALRIAPAWNRVILSIGSLFDDQKQYDSAKLYYYKAITIDPRYKYAYYNLGILFYNEKKYDSAQIYFYKAIDIDPKYTDAYYNLGIIYKIQQQYDSAKLYLHKAIDIDPKSIYAYTILGILFNDQGQYDSAKLYLHKAIDIDPKSAYAHTILGILFNDQRQYDSAKLHLQKAIAIDPNATVVNYKLGNIFNDQGRYDSAKLYYYKAINSDPKAIAVYYKLGNLFHKQKQYDSAKLYYHKAINIDPTYTNAYNDLGDLFNDQGQQDSAKLYYYKTINIDPKASAVYYKLGSLFHNQRQYDSAKLYYYQTININPKATAVYYKLANLFHNQRQYDSAKLYYYRAINSDSKATTVYYEFGNLFQNQNQYDSAKVYYRKAINIDPAYANAYYNLGILFYGQEQYDSAKLYYYKIIDISPKYKRAYNSLGNVFSKQGQYDSAKHFYYKAINIDANYSDAYYNLACLASLYKKIDEAIKNLELSFQRGYDNYEYLQQDTDLDNIRNTVEYKQLLKKYFPTK
jgi:tetratricopeptide (TPR) repeat protein